MKAGAIVNRIFAEIDPETNLATGTKVAKGVYLGCLHGYVLIRYNSHDLPVRFQTPEPRSIVIIGDEYLLTQAGHDIIGETQLFLITK